MKVISFAVYTKFLGQKKVTDVYFLHDSTTRKQSGTHAKNESENVEV